MRGNIGSLSAGITITVANAELRFDARCKVHDTQWRCKQSVSTERVVAASGNEECRSHKPNRQRECLPLADR